MTRLIVLLVSSLVAVGCAKTQAPPTTPVVVQVPDGKLPTGVTPLHYVLDLGIDANAGTTTGRVKIDLRLDAAQSEIWMHSREHVVSSVSVGGVSGTFKQVNEQGVAHVVLEKPVGPGDVELTINFTGVVQNSLEGLYKVTQGKDNYAFTQFETTHARQAFPCFDEPRFKTSFDVTLTIPKAHDAAGNTPEVKREDVGAGLQKYTFARTKPMPTYLLAWAVGPLDIVEAPPIPANDLRKEPLPFRGIAVRGRGERLKYALEQTPKILKAQEEYMGSPYPYAKLDIVAVPDFGSGAMENVGLITFRETLLLLQSDAPTSQRQWFAYVMAHELAHMWFGNLVTMPWWDDVWLNEAFATWFEIKAANEVYPEYNADVASLAWIQRAMGQDSLVSARQIRQPIVSHHDIPSAFDSITYEKGAGVITMFENYVGKEAFRTAIQNYMKKHEFGTATTEDFLAALSDATSPEVGKAFNTFLTQPGVPMVKLSLSCEGDASVLHVEQSRYFPLGSKGDAAKKWDVPLCVDYLDGSVEKTQCALLTATASDISLKSDACPKAVFPNAEASSYLRFSADDALLAKISAASMSPREHLALADSLGAAFGAGQITPKQLADRYAGMVKSGVRPVMLAPTQSLGWMIKRADDLTRPPLQGLGRKLYAEEYKRLGFVPKDGDSSDDELLRRSVTSFLALAAHDPHVRRDAMKLAGEFIKKSTAIKPKPDGMDMNSLGVALSVAAEDGGLPVIERLITIFDQSDDALLRSTILSALGHADDLNIIGRVHALTLDKRLRANEVTRPLGSQFSGTKTRQASWDWLKANYNALVDRVSSRVVARRILPLTHSFCSDEKAAEVQAFFDAKIEKIPGGPRALKNATEKIRLCAALKAHHAEGVRALLK